MLFSPKSSRMTLACSNLPEKYMKQTQQQSRHMVLWAVILCYLFPFIALSSIGAFMGRAPKNWFLLCIALLLSSIGSLTLYWVMAKWESSWKSSSDDSAINEEAQPLSHPIFVSEEDIVLDNTAIDPHSKDSNAELILAAEKAFQDSQQINAELQSDMVSLRDRLQQLSQEKEHSQLQLHKALGDLDAYKETCLQQQEQYKIYINELQDQLADQKQQAEKKQYQISHLETKVGDLTYEIKTLLQIAERHLPNTSPLSDQSMTSTSDISKTLSDYELAESHHEKLIGSSEGASIQLKRCLDIAQKIAGSNRFNTQISSFLDSPADNFTLDLRRLCDTLRSENNSTVVLYSPKESQPLFVNNHIRETTGWSPEKFVQNFNDIIHDSLYDWRQGLAGLSLKPETAIQLSLKTKSGPNILVKAHLGLIPTGIFRHYAIAILY